MTNEHKELASLPTDAGVAFAIGARLGRAEVAPLDLAGVPHVTVPHGVELKSLETLLERPRRIKQTVELETVASLIAYLQLYARKHETIILARRPTEENPGRIEAVLDYHVPAVSGTPGPGENLEPMASYATHKAVYSLALSPEFGEWCEYDGAPMDQAAFAQFFEDRIPHIAEPNGATLVEISRAFEAQKSVEFKSAIRVEDSTIRLTYNELVTQGNASGSMKIPAEFKLVIPVVVDGPKCVVNGRIRYKIESGGKLSLWYELIRPEDLVLREFLATLEQVRLAVADKVLGVLEGVRA